MNRQDRPGQTAWSSAKDFLPVILSGQTSKMSKNSTLSSPFDFLALAAIRGFSKATLIRSIPWSGERRSWQSLASTVQSRPPENRTATFDCGCWYGMEGGVGTFKTRNLRDSVNWCRSNLTEAESWASGVSPAVVESLNLPIADTYVGKLASIVTMERGHGRPTAVADSHSVWRPLPPPTVAWWAQGVDH